MSPEQIEQILNHKYSRWDLGECTIRHYLISLAAAVWDDGEGFSGKRPFGNSGWQWDVYCALADGGFITGHREEDGYWTELDEERGNDILAELFHYLKDPPPLSTNGLMHSLVGAKVKLAFLMEDVSKQIQSLESCISMLSKTSESPDGNN